MPRTIVIQDATLAGLAARPEAVKRLPYLLNTLADLAKQGSKKNCARCQASEAATILRDTYARARQAVAGLSTVDLQALKELLSADTIIVYIARPDGRVVPLTR